MPVFMPKPPAGVWTWAASPGQHDPAAPVVVDQPLVHAVHREPLHVGEPRGGVAGPTAVELGDAVEGVVGEAPGRQLRGAERGGDAPPARLGEGEREQGAVVVEPRVQPVGGRSQSDQDVREDDGLLEVRSPENGTPSVRRTVLRPPSAPTIQAARMTSTPPAGPADLGDHTVAVLAEAGELPLALDPPAAGDDQVGQHPLGLALRVVEQEREPGGVRSPGTRRGTSCARPGRPRCR